LLPWVVLDPWEEGIRVRLGKWVKDLKPGLHWMIPFADRVETVNVLPQRITLPNQSVRCADGKVIAISGALMYGIKNARRVWLEVEDHDESLVTLAMNRLAEYAASVPGDEVTVDNLQKHVLPVLRRQATKWGIDVRDLGVKDLAPHKVYRFMGDDITDISAMFGGE
jgi:regulator of protease activity HflC (stomatin/prohibitin superfamily)